MRDMILLVAMLLSIPFTLKRPMVGILTYTVFSLMNPHRLTYGFAGNFPFAMIVAIVTLVATLFSKEQKKLPFTPLVIQLLIVIAWVNLTSVFALNQDGAWEEWNTVMKTMLIVVLTITVTRTVNDVKALLLTVALSLGFWGFKGGLWTIATGGHNGLIGPQGTYIGDNNTLALAMVTSVPLMVALSSFAPTKWTRRAAIGLAVLTGVSVIGSYSRGALLGGTAMALFLWLKSSSKLKTGMLFALAIPLLLAAMPEQWMGRMHSIDNYQQDASAMGRINSWGFAINVANHLPLGGGFATFTPQIFQLYAPDPTVFFVAHSIYFQVLGEHGYIGLFLYLLLFFFAWRTGTRIVRKCGTNPEHAWAVTTARMCQVSIIGYMTAGAFLAMAYYDLPYYVLAILVCIEKVLFIAPQPDNTPPLRLPFLSRRKPDASAWKEPAPATRKR
jgi:probable O-glycosylation ligase (exosortase A-associated)